MDVNLADRPSRTGCPCTWWTGTEAGRAERVDVIDPATGAGLDSRTVTSFSGGTYLSWDVSGHVAFRVTSTAGPNAVLSGLFFGSPGGPAGPRRPDDLTAAPPPVPR